MASLEVDAEDAVLVGGHGVDSDRHDDPRDDEGELAVFVKVDVMARFALLDGFKADEVLYAAVKEKLHEETAHHESAEHRDKNTDG